MDIPENDYTFEDFIKYARMAIWTETWMEISYFGIYRYDWINAALSNGVTLFTEDGKNCYFNQESLADAIRFVKQDGER